MNDHLYSFHKFLFIFGLQLQQRPNIPEDKNIDAVVHQQRKQEADGDKQGLCDVEHRNIA